MKKELVEKLNDILGSEKELHILKGQIVSPQASKNTKNEEYYTFMVKTVTSSAGDEYSQDSNMYSCVMSAEVSKKYSKQDISDMKDYEVLLIVRNSARVRKTNKDGQDFRYNNITVFVQDIEKVRKIQKVDYSQRAVNL